MSAHRFYARSPLVAFADHLVHLPGNTWTAANLAAQLTKELTAITDYVRGKNAVLNGTETATPGHLDLRLEANLTVIGTSVPSQRFADGLEREYRTNRQEWIQQIVWRAVGLHSDELWHSLDPVPKLEAQR